MCIERFSAAAADRAVYWCSIFALRCRRHVGADPDPIAAALGLAVDEVLWPAACGRDLPEADGDAFDDGIRALRRELVSSSDRIEGGMASALSLWMHMIPGLGHARSGPVPAPFPELWARFAEVAGVPPGEDAEVLGPLLSEYMRILPFANRVVGGDCCRPILDSVGITFLRWARDGGEYNRGPALILAEYMEERGRGPYQRVREIFSGPEPAIA